jgi:hypothetical protein
MAGDWIKMRVGLISHPRVHGIADALLADTDYIKWSGLVYGVPGVGATSDAERSERHAALRVTRYVTVTALLKLWGYANEHIKGDEIVGIGPEDIDEIAGVPGFCDALIAVGWAVFDRSNWAIKFPNFTEHNTSATARSTSGAERQKRYRERLKSAKERDVTSDVTVTEREEKRREEKDISVTGVTELFDRFYSAYPRKVGKDAARKAFAKRKPTEALLAVMLAAIAKQSLAEKCARGEAQYVPHPATWLNEGRWEDEDGQNDDPYGLKTAL